jgi:hypothetical protein
MKQSKSIEISKDLVLILQIYRIYEKKGETNLLRSSEKKKGEELTKGGTGTRHPLPSGGTVTRGAVGTSSSSGGTAIGEACWSAIAGAGGSSSSGGTSSSDGTMIEGPCGTGTSSSSGGTVAVLGSDSKTSSSPTCMHFTLETSSSSSLTKVMPISSFVVSNVICKNHNIPK